MRKIILWLVIVFLTVAVISGCGKARTSGRGKEEQVPVKVMDVKLKTVSKTLEYIGNIIGQNEVAVYPKVSGKIIEKVKEDGNPITKGGVIAYIDRDEVGLKFEKAPVESPIAGTVGRIYVDIGSNVTPATPVALVSDMEKAEIHLDIPEVYLPRLSLGQEAEIAIDAHPNDRFIGRVTKISPVVDIETRTAPIEIMLDNAENKLHSGMFARVRLIIEEHKAVPTILKEAIIGREPETYVYVVEGDRAILKKVGLGIREGPYYEVKDGANAGDLVVIMGQQKLKDGAHVTVEMEDNP